MVDVLSDVLQLSAPWGLRTAAHPDDSFHITVEAA